MGGGATVAPGCWSLMEQSFASCTGLPLLPLAAPLPQLAGAEAAGDAEAPAAASALKSDVGCHVFGACSST